MIPAIMDFPAFPTSPSPPLAWLPCSPLGSGSFGHVSLALNLHTHSLFAVKSAPPTSSSALLALHNELRLLQSLDSPFVLRCLGAEYSDFSSASNQPLLRHIFLEYMDAGSLADLLRRSGGKLRDQKLVRHYTRAILQGLDFLHRNGVAHCDIKSHNILLGSSGNVKIADFGAARRLSEASNKGQTLIRGSPLWMAPEVMQGLDLQGTSADIWSLGCTVVEMLQGRPPWAHVTNLAALFLRVGCSEENPPLPESMSSEARDFLLQCFQRDPNARPTAAQLLQHPFISKLELAEKYNGDAYDLPSPRSTMNFVQSDSESDWEDESMVRSALIHEDFLSPAVKDGGSSGLACEKEQNLELGRSLDGQESNWITVRCTQKCNEERQVQPFIVAQTSERGETVVLKQAKRGCEVNLECAEFLRRRVG